MRPLVLSIGLCLLILGAAWAQNTSGGSGPELPVGQTFKNFEFPIYQDGKLKATLNATQATGVTQNRAEASDVKIQIYDNGAVSTTVTSPKADLYVSERKMRTKNTVQIERSDLEATAQTCDFDLTTKKYLLRTNVRVVLKNFDAGKNASVSDTSPSVAPPAPTPAVLTIPTPSTPTLHSTTNTDSLLDSPGTYSSTNSPPTPTTSTDTK